MNEDSVEYTRTKDLLSENSDGRSAKSEQQENNLEENDDDGVSYYDEEADASDSESGSSNVTPAATIERRKSKYLDKREQKAPYSKIYQLKLKLSKWLEPSCSLAKIPLLQ